VGPFLGALLATAFYVILKQYVMTFSHTPFHKHARARTRVSSVSSFLPFFAFFERRGLDADANNILKIHPPCLSLHSYQYWTLNPGQEATEPKMSPQDPMRIIRAEERSAMDNSDEV
jgi:hypothetical protein